MMKEFRGTEKQVAWANELFDNMVSKFDEIRKEAPVDFINALDKIENLFDGAYAGDVIALLSNNHNDDIRRFYQVLYTDIKVSGCTLARNIKKEVFGR